MPDLYTLFAKIQSLPKRRIAEVEDFVDFLALRRAGKAAKPPVELEETMERLEGRSDGERRVRVTTSAESPPRSDPDLRCGASGA